VDIFFAHCNRYDKDSSFIAVCTHKENHSYSYLSWGKYKEVVEKSKNYFKYLDNLKKDSNNVGRSCEVVFSVE